ncbi:MAG: DNA adenine methylase [Pedobacter sp.]|nr:DNA adenine methylase [Pedobacter sp.]
MNKKLRPLLKWTGGKFDEFVLFSAHIPTFERYIEPFFGGGGVFFSLQPQVPALINDKSTDLINFYNHIADLDFKKELFLYADAWDELGDLASFLWYNCGVAFINFTQQTNDIAVLKDGLIQYLDIFLKRKLTLTNANFIVDSELFKAVLLASIVDKANRIKIISSKKNDSFTTDELCIHFETGVRSGAYLFFRRLLNLYYNHQVHLSSAKAAANWYFVREFCYGAMFRFNSKGEFNIPYGGITYNRKKFREKVEQVFTKEVANLFKQTTLFNEDFESFLIDAKLTTGDFIFVDPPYDSEFSEYDQSAFTQKDQKRLASFLKATSAKWMVIIKETPFISKLYTHPGINILTFYKNYTYNVRGRNKRGVMHLIITNY